MAEWKPYKTGTVAESWIDLELRAAPGPDCPPDLRASVRFDGCVHLTMYMNGADPDQDPPERVAEDSDYMHICDLAGHIATLQALLEKVRAHFGPDWP